MERNPRHGLILMLVRIGCFLAHPRRILAFRRLTGRLPDPALPRGFHEKFVWRKLFDRAPLFVQACDKLEARALARELCPEVRSARTLWVGRDPGAIPDDLLVDGVVVKASHGCRWNWPILGASVDRAALEARARRWLGSRFGQGRGEWGYGQVEPRLFVEEMLRVDGAPVDREYKFYASAGQVSWLYVKHGRFSDTTGHSIFDREGRCRITRAAPGHGTIPCELPAVFPRMRAIAERLSEPFDFVRVDLYECKGEVWFSEYTVYPMAGYDWVDEPDLMARMNDAWDLRRSWFLTEPQRGWRGRYAAALRARLDAPGSARASAGVGEAWW